MLTLSRVSSDFEARLCKKGTLLHTMGPLLHTGLHQGAARRVHHPDREVDRAAGARSSSWSSHYWRCAGGCGAASTRSNAGIAVERSQLAGMRVGPQPGG
jgi:hypothetical protein